MNAHDSEKVVGTLIQQGYRQVETVEAAGLVLYNTCSIRDKAEQKGFHRLDTFKRNHKKKVICGVGGVGHEGGGRGLDKGPHTRPGARIATSNQVPGSHGTREAGHPR